MDHDALVEPAVIRTTSFSFVFIAAAQGRRDAIFSGLLIVVRGTSHDVHWLGLAPMVMSSVVNLIFADKRIYKRRTVSPVNTSFLLYALIGAS